VTSELATQDPFSFEAATRHHVAAVTTAALVFAATTSVWMLLLGAYQHTVSGLLGTSLDPARVVLALALPSMLFVVAWIVGGTLSVIPFWTAMWLAQRYEIRSRTFFLCGAIVSALAAGKIFWRVQELLGAPADPVTSDVPDWLIVAGPGLILGGLAGGDKVWRRITTS
jgi:hypothetical protein